MISNKSLELKMIKYNSVNQISIEEFKTPFYFGLDKTNRWVRLAEKIPWDEFAKIYSKALCEDFGRPALDARIVIGALIIKHRKGLSDEETIEEIKENAYLQYFLGYEEFSHKAPFDPSLFVTLRNRLGIEVFDKMNQAFIDGVQKTEAKEKDQAENTTSINETVSDQSGNEEPERQEIFSDLLRWALAIAVLISFPSIIWEKILSPFSFKSKLAGLRIICASAPSSGLILLKALVIEDKGSLSRFL